MKRLHILLLLSLLALITGCQHSQQSMGSASGNKLQTELGKALSRDDEYLLIGIYVPDDSVTISRYEDTVLLNILISKAQQPDETVAPASSKKSKSSAAADTTQQQPRAAVINETFKAMLSELLNNRKVPFEEQETTLPLANGKILTSKIICADVTGLDTAELADLVRRVFDCHFRSNFSVAVINL